jgi:hypothetical protein
MSWKEDDALARRAWRGPRERYDLLKEGMIAVGVVFALGIALTTLLGSPRLEAVSFRSWARNAPQDFAATALTELVGTSETATYGPPYNGGTSQLQSLGPVSPQAWAGIQLPVNAAQDLVLAPLSAFAPFDSALEKALAAWNGASPGEQAAWGAAAQKAKLVVDGNAVALQGGDTGPIPALLGGMLTAARSGALDAQLVNAPGRFYSMDNTKALLFIADGNYLGQLASKYALQGSQWGVMNEIGSWPGQPWLWFYTLFYQVPPWSTVGTDIVVIATVTPLFLVLIFLPFIPGLRSLPRVLGIYRLVWRSYYRKHGAGGAGEGKTP